MLYSFLCWQARKRLGRRSILTEEQENDLVNRVHRLVEIGLPSTPNIVRRSVFSYVTARNIPNPFSQTSQLAGRKWLKLFFKRHSEVVKRKAQQMNPARAHLESDSSSESEASLHDDSYTESDNEPLIKFISASTGDITEEEVPYDDLDMSFKDMGFLVTPEIKVTPSQRKPAINSRAQEVTRNLFSSQPKVLQSKSAEKNVTHPKSAPEKIAQAKSAPKKSSHAVESWFCFLCETDRQIDMRLCSRCNRYVHEKCVGLTKAHKEIFICQDC